MLLAFLFTILAVTTTSFCATTEDVRSEGIQNSMPANSSMPPILDATASKLVRYRSKPPPNFFRHKTQPNKRSRPRIIKSPPKIKNNRPIFTHYEQNLQPSSYYKFKPEIHTSTLAYKPAYNYDEIHYEVSSEYPKKESNYETQAMELDFYGGETYPKKKTASQYEYSKPQKTYVKPQKVAPQYEFTKPQKTYIVQRPHNVYGNPKESSYNSYEFNFDAKPEVHYEISYHEESPEQEYEPAPQQQPKQKYEDFPPYGAPPKKYHQPEQVSYQIPDNKYEAPGNPYHPQEIPSKEGPYPAYDKKLSNNGYNYNNDFSEPPTDIHIIHSPSYDIEPLPQKHAHPQNNYEQGHETYGPPPHNDNYGPPSQVYGAPEYNNKSPGNHHAPMDSYHQPNSGHFAEPPESYLPPPHLPEDLPLNKNHMPPGYDYPKSSYEVPLYDPIPFESTTAEHEEDFFPPNNYNRPAQHDHVSESSTHIQHIPSTSAVSTTSSSTQEHEQVQEGNTKVHRFSPSKRRVKKPNRYQTTAKIPILNEEKAVPEAPSSEFLDEVISTTSTFRPRRKRKRTKAPLVAEKHNLDAPELKEAFESGRDNEQTDELTAHASNIKENVQPQESSKNQKITDFSPSHSWNPMRIRTKQQTNTQRGQRTASQTPLNDLKNVEVISIQKSHSHSYYAGTEPPATKRTRKMTSRADAIQMATVSTTTLKAENALKPTRGLVIDTTYFKVKGNEEEDFYDGTGMLPKNHKLF